MHSRWNPNAVRGIPLILFIAALEWAGCTRKVDSQPTNLQVTVPVSLGNQAQFGNGPVGNASVPGAIDRADISDDGRYVVFTSMASNLVPNDNNNASDVFLWDNQLRTCQLVSINVSGTGSANQASFSPAMSGDGRYVVFVSTATDLDPSKVSSLQDIFVRDMVLGVTSLVSRATGALGTPSNGNSSNPQISKGGRYVVFHSNATNLDPADTDTLPDIYRRDIGDPALIYPTILISRADGATGAKAVGGGGNGSLNPSICRDGHLIVFQSDGGNLVTTSLEGGPIGNTLMNIYLRDANANTTLRVTVGPGPSDPDGLSEHATISGDGSSVTFRSFASNIVQKFDNNADIYWRSLLTPETAPGFAIMSVHTGGVIAGSGCDFPVVSETGLLVVFQSPSPDMVDNDTNGVPDVFLHDRSAGITTRVSVATFGGELNGQSGLPRISGNSLYVVFQSFATNVSDLETNGAANFYMRGPPFN